MKMLTNEKGLALSPVLGFLCILGILSATAVMVMTTDLKIASNYRESFQAYYAARVGLEEARLRLGLQVGDPDYIGDPEAGFDENWSAYILTSDTWQPADDPYYDGTLRNYIPTTASQTNTSVSANSIQSTVSYFVRIRHKREFDAELAGHTPGSPHYYDGDGSTETHSASSPGNLVYYGYGNPASPTTPVQYTTSDTTADSPVEIVTAYGISADSLQIVEAEIATLLPPPIVSALYAKGDVTGNGSALTISGIDECSSSSGLPPIYTLSPATTTLNGSPILTGSPADPISGSLQVDIAGYINRMKGSAEIIITSDQNGTTYGSSENPVIVYSNTDNPENVGGLKMQNVTGYGILLVEGDLVLGGGFDWNGLVVCTGVLTFNGGGSGVNISGALLAKQTITMNGGVDIRYNSCAIKKAMSSLGPGSRKILVWRKL